MKNILASKTGIEVVIKLGLLNKQNNYKDLQRQPVPYYYKTCTHSAVWPSVWTLEAGKL